MSKKNKTIVQVIENATLDDARLGDHITWERSGEWRGSNTLERREGIAYHQDEYDDWQTREGAYLTDGDGEGVTLTIRRPITEEG